MAVGLDFELASALADILDHLEESGVHHGFAAREGEVGHLAVHELLEHGKDFALAQFVAERFARPAFLDAVQAREIALVGDLPGDVQRGPQVAGTGLCGRARL